MICQRRRGTRFELDWEFPGGKVEAGEGERACLERELREELGIETEIGGLVARVRHRYPETPELELAFYEVARFKGEPTNRIFEAIAWVHPKDLGSYKFLAADCAVLEVLAKW